MSARVDMLKEIVATHDSTAWWSGLTRYAGWAIIGLGFLMLLPTLGADPAWGAFLIVVGLIAQRAAPPTAMTLYAVTLGWAGIINGLFGRLPTAGALFLATAITVSGAIAAYRVVGRPLPAAQGLAWGSLALACTGAGTLILAFGGSLIAFFTGWFFDARLADYLAAAGVHQAVLALGLALGAFIQPGRTLWAAVLGIIAALTAISAYIGLLLLAQG